MSTIDSYDVVDEPRRHRSHRHREQRDDREPRYVDTQDTYYSRDIVRRPGREDSDLSVEEIRREFPPPGAAGYVQRRSDRYDGSYRSRSAERGAYLGDPRRSYNDLGPRRKEVIDEEVVKPRRRSLSRNQKILAAAGGAALAVGAKELWDRREAHGGPVQRNVLGSAAAGAAGAFAAYEGAEFYAKHAKKGEEKEKKKTYVAHRGRDGEIDEYYSSEEEDVKPKRSKSRRKSLVEGALGLAGLGAAAKASGSGRSRRGSDSGESRHRSRGRDESPQGAKKFQQAAKAALLAGATEAFRVRNEPGGWGGQKGKRILTAAIGAGGIDAAADRDPDHKSKRHILEAVVGGLAGNRLINGSRSNVSEGGRSGRSRSRSRSRGPGGGGGGLAALATAGIGALAGKKLLDRSRSRSRGGSEHGRRHSRDSYDSRSPSPRGDRRRRSRSVTDYARKGLAALGIGEAAAHESDKHRRDDRSRHSDSDDGYSSRRSRHHGSGRSDNYDDRSYDDSRSSRRSARQRDGGRNRRIAEGRESPSDSESSLGSSSGDEKRIKKMKGKQLLTAGLATVATIHAAHNVYQSMEKRAARRKAVQEGEMTPEEAKKLKAKATLQDAASIGIAALGIKGAISEIKEANEIRRECREFREKKEERHKKRLERQQKSKNNGSNRGGQDYGPRYIDANPYSTHLPAPPVGYDRN
ncbi:hypothetical protein F5884DRAFT_857917 [Xylogone sp. PMI_703]|nr:hypothetical protein F5884DRAFT_857917 [Xylogone sp. PMI_703]